MYQSHELEILREMKEKLCYVAEDFNAEMEKFAGKEREAYGPENGYRLPDGNHIQINTERFRCPEVLFNPEIAGIEA